MTLGMKAVRIWAFCSCTALAGEHLAAAQGNDVVVLQVNPAIILPVMNVSASRRARRDRDRLVHGAGNYVPCQPAEKVAAADPLADPPGVACGVIPFDLPTRHHLRRDNAQGIGCLVWWAPGGRQSPIDG